mmetsp:Transcript_33263/g.61836  ORF Transcript_33263/g.61836 Transcript_33263/m.61836 type:complete len:94 (+) Transcript_33263:224-505(+)
MGAPHIYGVHAGITIALQRLYTRPDVAGINYNAAKSCFEAQNECITAFIDPSSPSPLQVQGPPTTEVLGYHSSILSCQRISAREPERCSRGLP